MPLVADAVRADRLQRTRAQWPRLMIAAGLLAAVLVFFEAAMLLDLPSRGGHR